MKKLFYIFIFFVPFFLISQQHDGGLPHGIDGGLRGGGGAGGNMQHGGGPHDGGGSQQVGGGHPASHGGKGGPSSQAGGNPGQGAAGNASSHGGPGKGAGSNVSSRVGPGQGAAGNASSHGGRGQEAGSNASSHGGPGQGAAGNAASQADGNPGQGAAGNASSRGGPGQGAGSNASSRGGPGQGAAGNAASQADGNPAQGAVSNPALHGGKGERSGGGPSQAGRRNPARQPSGSESPPSKKDSGKEDKISKEVQAKAVNPKAKEIPKPLQKDIQARIPSFNRREMEQPQSRHAGQNQYLRQGQIPQTVREKQDALHLKENSGVSDIHEIPKKVAHFLETTRGITKPAQKPSQAIGSHHPAPRIQFIQKNLGVKHPQIYQWFNPSFFIRHRFYPPYYRQNRFSGWNRPNWVIVNNFLGWGWGYPYDYGVRGPVIVTSPPVYNTTQYYTTIQQAPATEDPASIPKEEPSVEPAETQTPDTPRWTPQQQLGTQESTTQEEDWLSLGVFAAGRSAEDVQFGHQFIQLAINKEGILSGTYYNASTDQVHPLGGQIDQESQLAAWTVTDDPDSPVMTTGIYNLTDDQVAVQVHFPNGVQQSWILIRLSSDQ